MHSRFSRVLSSGFSSGFSSGVFAFFGINLYEDNKIKIKIKIKNSNKNKNILSQEDIYSRQIKGDVIIGVDKNVYALPEAFVNSHPGGAKILQYANGYNVKDIWQNNSQYNFHINPLDGRQKSVQEYLNSYFIGETNSPLPDMPESKITVLAFKVDPRYYNFHNQYNIEAKVLSFNDLGETEYFFVRDHAEYPLDHQDLNISLNNGKSVNINNDELREYPQDSVFQPIICAGAGRSKFDCKTSGTSWGAGADAIGTIRVKGTPINKLLDLLNMQPKKPCLMVVTGSDGYDAVVHSDEFDRFYITTQKENGDDLPEIHGRERRLIGEGVPGFRNIKSVSSIKFIPEYSKEELALTLESRLKTSIAKLSNIMSETNIQLLASCPNYDAYLLKNVDNKKIYGFNAYFPPSVKITSLSTASSDNSNTINASGVAFSGENIIKKVVACVTDSENNKSCKKANISNNGNSRFVFWDAEWVAEFESINQGDLTVTAVAVNDDKSRSNENKDDNNNYRGLYYYKSKQDAKVDFKTKSSKGSNRQC